MKNLLILFDAKRATKTILFTSKQINIRFYSICFELNMSGAPYPGHQQGGIKKLCDETSA
jgi:hypothetical protein